MLGESSRDCFRLLVFSSVIGLASGCSTAPPASEGDYSTERRYEMACDSASRDIDTLMVHWDNLRSGERMPAQQVMQARQAMRVVGPVCDDIDAALMLDNVGQARVEAAFRTLEHMARNLPRLPAGS
ncbi:hypothetical protein [Chiayiivirga flava]|uniref:Lipoprotein n=1 Tax=Chiayiivirga flava TaxID=659595 RepID=A0A7W8G1E8_9GAMM|nr:hypothetical protein [Chiayiivirga flava]MBB5209364.1 hypothetical protein [Chiayiivirga flava]